MSGQPRISEATLRRVRDYAVAEPGFTCSFAAWDLSREVEPITFTAVKLAVRELLRKGVVGLVEDGGTAGKVYAYVPPPQTNGQPPASTGRFRELDDSRIGELRPANSGAVVPHTRIEGPSHSPGRDRRRQAAGVRLARGKGK